LRQWFRARRRQLPWRTADSGLRDPYRTWISEIMLQQTRVEAVIPYFEAFLKRFPDVFTLAQAPEQEVLMAWSGLGYYRRARYLHAAARDLADRLDGVFPESAEGLRSLPGIGPYTSAAIASLAFGERIPVVDGNVKRVVARWSGLALAADDPALERAARLQGESWMEQLPKGNPGAAGELNESLMELGAVLCTTRNPTCGECPLHSCCDAFEQGRQGDFPLPKRKKNFVDLEMVYLVPWVGVRVQLLRREQGWNPGLFEPPSMQLKDSSRGAAVASLQDQYGSCAPEFLGQVRHTITHHRIRAAVYHAPSTDAEVGEDWVDPATVPLTALAKKVLRMVQESS
ncbi:MAG: A/G-specific adenine glycosylase, partial [Planctomycetota bacterium]